jgi:uncharacterized membrane protein
MAVLWGRDGSVQPLGTLPGATESRALAVNERGDVVGSSGGRAFLWSGGRVAALPMLAGDTESEAVAIANNGTAVGWSTGPGGSRAVRWARGTVEALGMLPGGTTSRARDVNERGDIVGASASANGERAVIWDGAGAAHDLNALIPPAPFLLVEALPINTRGVILAIGRDTDGSDHADHDHSHDREEFPVRVFLLDPRS